MDEHSVCVSLFHSHFSLVDGCKISILFLVTGPTFALKVRGYVRRLEA